MDANPITQREHLLLAGDWHGNSAWAGWVIRSLPRLLPNEASPLILQLGDFGIWPGRAGKDYLSSVSMALNKIGAELWFVDGNHEDHPYLIQLRQTRTQPDGRVMVRKNIFWLPRGHRWRWHERTWLAVGGAVSVDKVFRTEGRDWWPQEELTRAEVETINVSGKADVMVCHDRPSAAPLALPPPPPSWDLRDLARAELHRELLQEVVDVVQPELLLHGHYHLSDSKLVGMKHGVVQLVGLDADGVNANLALLNIRTLEGSRVTV